MAAHAYQALTLYDKLWQAHALAQDADGRCLVYVDRHLVNEVTSPQAFAGLRRAGRTVHRPSSILACADHNTPTRPERGGIADPLARAQVAALEANIDGLEVAARFGASSPRRGILHVVGPELGATLPGMTIACGDSHTSTHGAFAALAFGIGTSDVEHVLATQCIWMSRSRAMRVEIDGVLGIGVTAKDVALAVLRTVGADGGTGHVIEYTGQVVARMSMEERMTLCNMAIEAGARSGIVAVDTNTLAYLKGRPMAPEGDLWDRAVKRWQTLRSDDEAVFDKTVSIDAASIRPMVTWGTSPDMVAAVTERVPIPSEQTDRARRAAFERALAYMDILPGTRITDIRLDRIFIGSCTNARIEDLRAAAAVVRGRRVHETIRQAMVVPGSGMVKRQAESEGLDAIFRDAGFEWRDPGCSMCLGMNADMLLPGERCASTSNRNFEGRQGAGGRSHLVSPAMAAAAAIAGHFVDVSEAVP